MVDDKKSSRARGLDRAFDILDYLRERKCPLRPNDIAIGLKAPKSSIYELIKLLVEQSVLEYSDKEGRVFLGRRLHFWGNAYLNEFDLVKEARPYLEAITQETHETSQLCMLDGDKYLVMLMNEGIRPFRISASVGIKLSIPWTASGRLLLSHLSDDQIKALIPVDDLVMPDRSQLSLETFITEVRKAKQEGIVTFDSITDTYTHCFAAPIYDERNYCIATLCMVVPKNDAKENYTKYCELLKASANKISMKLSGDKFDKSRLMG